MSLNGKPHPTVRAYASVLADFGRAHDFVLRGVWEALRHAPTFTLTDGSKLRPLTAQTLLQRTTEDGATHFAVVPFEAVGDEPLTGFVPERAWRVVGHDQP